MAVAKVAARAASVKSATTRFCVRRSERDISGTALAMPGRLRGHIVLRGDSHDLTVAPDHGVLAETALTLQRFRDGAPQSIQCVLVFRG
jgi:hypothetical protein